MSIRGKYISLITPPAKVNQTGQSEIAEPTASLLPRVHLGGAELPRKAGLSLVSIDIRAPVKKVAGSVALLPRRKATSQLKA